LPRVDDSPIEQFIEAVKLVNFFLTYTRETYKYAQLVPCKGIGISG